MKKTPKLRFKNFVTLWEKDDLSSIATIYDGTHSTPKYTTTGVPFYSVESITNKQPKFKYISQAVYEKEILRAKIERSDILMTRIGDIGTTKVITDDNPKSFYVSLALIKLLHKINCWFMKYQFDTLRFKKELHHRTIHTAFPIKINLGEIGKSTIYTTDIVEQKKISDFFRLIDKKIKLQQSLIENIKDYKKGCLQGMFPKNDNKTPNIRFSEFTDTWEQRKLGDITKIKTGSSDLQDASADGKYPMFVRSENIERSNRYIFDGEAILIPGEGRLGEIYHYIDGKFDYHQRVYKISNFSDYNIDGKFVLFDLQSNFKQHAHKFNVKATVESLRLPMLTEYKISIPKTREQILIGETFKQIDSLITLHQSKLEKIQELKKGLLQQMFV